jgi:LTXXQ motif family protein
LNWRKLMSPSRIAALAAVALLSATAAIAQTAGSGGPAPAPQGFEHHDPVARMKAMCIEHFARSAGRLAYLEARLQLTADQQPQWDSWRQAVAAGSEKERTDCLADLPATGTRPTALDRDSHMEKMMATKVATLQAARPALEALYRSLTPEQRAVFDRPMHGEHEGQHHHHMPEAQPL